MQRPPHILLIDDDHGLASVIQKALETTGYQVSAANDGATGFAMARKNSYDVVLTDFQLPDMDGMTIAHKLHAEKPQIPVILMTAHHSTDIVIQATRRGAWDYLIKPFPLTTMLHLMERAVRSSQLAARVVEVGDEYGVRITEIVSDQAA